MKTEKHKVRRAYTALDADGRSEVSRDEWLSDEGGVITTLWSSALPADNSGDAVPDTPFSQEAMHEGGTFFIHVRMRPGTAAPMHSTDTLDYITMISGEITLVTETGEITLGGGDTFVDRGIYHAWRNDGDVDAVFTTVTVPSAPVGAGKRLLKSLSA